MLSRFVHEGIEALRVGRFDLGISSSCIVYRLGDTVIDTGPPNQWAPVRSFLAEREVARVVITHHHEDHSGNGARLVRETTARVFVPAGGTDLVRRGFRLRPYQRVIWGAPDRFAPELLPSELELSQGLRLRAIPTPGHSLDMTCFLEPNRGWLFTGDLYISSTPRFFRAGESVAEQIESLRRVLALDFATVLCAHRGVVTDGPAAMRRKLDYLVTLRDQVRALRSAGRSVGAITRTLLGREKAMSVLSFFDFSKRNLVRSCLEGYSAEA